MIYLQMITLIVKEIMTILIVILYHPGGQQNQEKYVILVIQVLIVRFLLAIMQIHSILPKTNLQHGQEKI